MTSRPTAHSETVALTTAIKNKSSQTLLDFLCRRFHYHNRSEWAERIANQRVTVNDRQASEGQPLLAGDVVTYLTTPWAEPIVNRNYKVVYEDKSLFVVSKPAPLPVHAVGAYFQNTLMAMLRKDIPEAKDYQLIHRLDAETSGLLLMVKDRSLVSVLQKQWKALDTREPSPLAGEGRVRGDGAVELPDVVGARHALPESDGAVKLSGVVAAGPRACPPDVLVPSFVDVGARHALPEGGSVRKTYRAIVFGKFPDSQKRLEAPIALIKNGPIRMKAGVDWAKGKPSITEFELLETRKNFSLVEMKLLTGRTHQIRVHLEHLGYPIVGDKLYSGTDETFLHFYEKGWDDWLKEKILLPRMALHAYRLDFSHPGSGERMTLEDPLPEDLMNFWNGIR